MTHIPPNIQGGLSPIIGGKVLSRDMSHLKGLSVRDRRNYIMLSASSDAAGRFRADSLSIDVDAAGIRRLVKKKLVEKYKHRSEDVYYIPGGKSHERYASSPISTEPPPMSEPSPERAFLHRDHRLLYMGLKDLEVVVLHALINLSDYHGRGEMNISKLTDILGRCKSPEGEMVGKDDVIDACAKLQNRGCVLFYGVDRPSVQAGVRPYYAALDAKQWGMRFIPGSKIPPPPGEQWDYSFDSQEGLAWYQHRRERRTEKREKRSKTSSAGAIGRAREGTASEADLDYLFSKRPHRTLTAKSVAVIFAAHVYKEQVDCHDSMLLEALNSIRERGLPVETEWFKRVAGLSVEDALSGTNERLRATGGVEEPGQYPDRARLRVIPS